VSSAPTMLQVVGRRVARVVHNRVEEGEEWHLRPRLAKHHAGP
jgi:hypothetical protein